MEKSCPFAEIGFFDRLMTELFWPIRTTNSRGRLVSYKNVHGKIHGNGSRRFLASRQSGARYHVGVDLYGNHKDIVVACEDGTIVNHYPFYAGTHCLFVQNDSGTVINYGEVEKGVVERVRPGQGITRHRRRADRPRRPDDQELDVPFRNVHRRIQAQPALEARPEPAEGAAQPDQVPADAGQGRQVASAA